jgi:hypothetical protein
MYICISIEYDNSTYCKYKVLDININLPSFLVQSIQGIVSNMGCASKSQSIEIQNPWKSPFNNMDLVWKKDFQHGRPHIIKVECAYIPHAWILEFLNGEQSHEYSWMGWNIYKWVPPQENVKMPRIQNHFGHIWYDVLLFILVIWNLFFNLILYQTLGLKLIAHFLSMHVGMD